MIDIKSFTEQMNRASKFLGPNYNKYRVLPTFDPSSKNNDARNVKYYNYIPLKGKFMNVECDIPVGTEFTTAPFLFGGVDASMYNPWSYSIIANDPEWFMAMDKLGNRIYSICILHSETFFTHFVPSLSYTLLPHEFDSWEDRWYYIDSILKTFAANRTKNLFLDYLMDKNSGAIFTPEELIIATEKDTILNREVLWYVKIEGLKYTVDNFDHYVKARTGYNVEMMR